MVASRSYLEILNNIEVAALEMAALDLAPYISVMLRSAAPRLETC